MPKTIPIEKWELWQLQLVPGSSPDDDVERHRLAVEAAFPGAGLALTGLTIDDGGRLHRTLLADVPQLLLDLAARNPDFDPREALYSFWGAPPDPDQVDGLDRLYAGAAVIELGGGGLVVRDAEEIRKLLYDFRPARRGSRERRIYDHWLFEIAAALAALGEPAGMPAAGD